MSAAPFKSAFIIEPSPDLYNPRLTRLHIAEAGRKRRYEAALINHPSPWLMNHKKHK
jgi:hypothetical protein